MLWIILLCTGIYTLFMFGVVSFMAFSKRVDQETMEMLKRRNQQQEKLQQLRGE